MDPIDSFIAFAGCFAWAQGAALVCGALAFGVASRNWPMSALERIAGMHEVDRLDPAAFRHLTLYVLGKRNLRAGTQVICNHRRTRAGLTLLSKVLAEAHCAHLVLATNRPMTRAAKAAAQAEGIKVLDRRRLARLMLRTNAKAHLQRIASLRLETANEIAPARAA